MNETQCTADKQQAPSEAAARRTDAASQAQREAWDSAYDGSRHTDPVVPTEMRGALSQSPVYRLQAALEDKGINPATIEKFRDVLRANPQLYDQLGGTPSGAALVRDFAHVGKVPAERYLPPSKEVDTLIHKALGRLPGEYISQRDLDRLTERIAFEEKSLTARGLSTADISSMGRYLHDTTGRRPEDTATDPLVYAGDGDIVRESNYAQYERMRQLSGAAEAPIVYGAARLLGLSHDQAVAIGKVSNLVFEMAGAMVPHMYEQRAQRDAAATTHTEPPGIVRHAAEPVGGRDVPAAGRPVQTGLPGATRSMRAEPPESTGRGGIVRNSDQYRPADAAGPIRPGTSDHPLPSDARLLEANHNPHSQRDTSSPHAVGDRQPVARSGRPAPRATSPAGKERPLREYEAMARKLRDTKVDLENIASRIENVTERGNPKEWAAAKAASDAYRASVRVEGREVAAREAGVTYHEAIGSAGPGEGADFRRPDGSLHEVKTHTVARLEVFIIDQANLQMLAYLLKDLHEHGLARNGTVEHVFIKPETKSSPMRVVRVTVDPLQGRNIADLVKKKR
ncbi:hypothetical protein [Rugosimonospora africana]|uniref:Uncharacterized protein n=1 Tax=Rugosimonospora africana TaxID=556532 RepID=A0A8J3VWU5_9ACTN|nr:hypothetical protein [Rugosimonospora africana]GIH21163.1 hypothetical protein Raf01_93350 [Rugosimonospora africana]